MAQANWQQVKKIFADALRQPPEERRQFLNRVCSDNKILRREVESLLSSYENAESFMETAAVEAVADEILMESREFAKGQILGHYEILGHIGTGGMGDVYLAHDSKLDRRVALKILRENLSWESHAKRRLLREARAAAKLDHPNICAIYEISESDDCSFIVMQYVDGKTLAEILEKERLSIAQSLNLAIQIAEALEEAHSHNIIHRDIKPSNIVVNPKGQLKVLDFGLAKFINPEPDEESAKRLSSSGAIMGTVPFMSPEQLRGKKLDTRTDIFSFGAVFYEMLGGISPFQKDSNAEAISAILKDEPDWTHIPPELRSIVKKSLMKEKTERYQTAKDFAQDLRNIGATSSKADGKFWNRIFSRKTAKQKVSKRRYYFWKSSDSGDGVTPNTKEISGAQITKPKRLTLNHSAVYSASFGLFVLIGAMVWLVWQFPNKSDPHSYDSLRSVRLVSWKSGASSPYSDFRVSHDGKMIAYSSTQEGENEGIYIKQTTAGEDFRVTKDEWSNHSPIWSPDDQRIAFASFREGQSGIYVCPSLGGQTTLLKVIGEGNVSLRYWSKDGSAIFYETNNNLFRIDIKTQETSQITNLASAKIPTRYFSISPNEDKTVYLDKTDEQDDLWVMPINGGTPFRLTNDKDEEIQPRWHPDGKRILYTVFRNNHYQINLADTNGRNPEQLTRSESEFELIDVSSDGSRIFYLSWEDKSDIWGVKVESGEEFVVAAGIESEFWSDVSPDGKSILYQSNSSPYPAAAMSESSIIIKSLTNQSPQISVKGYNPRWLPDSRRIAFLREETANKYALWTFNTKSGEETQITDNSLPSPPHAILPNNRGQTGEFGWSPESNQVTYLSKNLQTSNILMTAPETNQIVNFTNNDNPNVIFYCPKWSPDGKLIGYITQQKPVSKEEKQLWKIWINKEGKSKEIYSTAASLRLLGWSANGELLLEMTAGAMKSSPLDVNFIKVSVSGDNQIINTFKNIYATSMTLSADRKTVAFTSRQDDKDNIFTALTNGGKAQKITANANAKLYFGSPAWSPDGKTIFFDKQEENNTISMFENFK